MDILANKTRAINLKFDGESYPLRKVKRSEALAHDKKLLDLSKGQDQDSLTSEVIDKVENLNKEFLLGVGMPEEVYEEIDNEILEECIKAVKGVKKN